MKTTQVLATLFPLAVMASNHGGAEGHYEGDTDVTGTVTATSAVIDGPGTVSATYPPGTDVTGTVTATSAVIDGPGTVTATYPPGTDVTGTVTATYPPGTDTFTATYSASPIYSSGYPGGPTTGEGSAVFKDIGCYSIKSEGKENPLSSDGTGMVSVGLKFNAKGACAVNHCSSYKYAATQGDKCYCADALDDAGLIIATDDAVCNYNCPGYDLDACGGEEALTIYENDGWTAGGGVGSGNGDGYATANPASGSGYDNGTSTETSSGPDGPSNTGGPVEAGAAALGQSVVGMLMAVCGVGAAMVL